MENLISPHFKFKEFACNDGTPVPEYLHYNMRMLAVNLEVIRAFVGRPIIVNSAYRTISHNTKVGGASQSQHLSCNASDIHVKGMQPKELYNIIKSLMQRRAIEQGGLFLYDNFVHYDRRGIAIFRDYRKSKK